MSICGVTFPSFQASLPLSRQKYQPPPHRVRRGTAVEKEKRAAEVVLAADALQEAKAPVADAHAEEVGGHSCVFPNLESRRNLC